MRAGQSFPSRPQRELSRRRQCERVRAGRHPNIEIPHRFRVLHKIWLSACGPQHLRSRSAGYSCSRGVCLIQRLTGLGYTASSHVASAFVTSSKRWFRGRTIRKQFET
jgi:hypothetical protein